MRRVSVMVCWALLQPLAAHAQEDSGLPGDTGWTHEDPEPPVLEAPVRWFDSVSAGETNQETVVTVEGWREREVVLDSLWNARGGGPEVSPLPQRIELPLFDDQVLTAKEIRYYTEWDGSVVWVGQIEGTAHGRLVAVFGQDFTIAGIYGGDAAFKIRTDDEGVTTIQEQPAYEAFDCETTEAPELDKDDEPVFEMSSLGTETETEFWFDQVKTVDYLVTYTTTTLNANSHVDIVAQANLGVAQTNQAYYDSGVDLRMRLVAVVFVPYVEPNPVSGTTLLNQFRDASIPEFADVPLLRDEYGADLVSLAVMNIGSAGVSNTIHDGFPNGGHPDTAHSLIKYSAMIGLGQMSLAHETAHSMGVHHGLYVGDSGPPLAGYEYARGYWDCVDPVRYTTITSGNPPDDFAPQCYDVNGAFIEGYKREPIFGNPNRTWIDSEPSGDATNGDEARRLNETGPIVATYRPSRTWFPGSAALTSPSPGAALTSSTQTFTWTNVSAPQHHLWVGWLPGENNYYNGPPDGGLNGTSKVVTGLPTIGSPIFVRVWTETLDHLWVYRDYRFSSNAAQVTMVGCNQTANDPAPAAFSAAGCSIGATAACSWDSSTGTFGCDLQPWTTGSTASTATLITPPSSEYFHFAAWGTTRSNQKFCCAIRDHGEFIDRVSLYGGSANDSLSFRYSTNTLQSTGQQTLAVEAGGRNGGDTVYGPAYWKPGLLPLLKGGDGGDWIVGGPLDERIETGGGSGDLAQAADGEDLIIATGTGSVTLEGQDGHDVMIISGPSGWLEGNDGNDVLCANQKSVTLRGGNGSNRLYMSSTATGTWSAQTAAGGGSRCGKTSWGNSWAGGCFYDLTSLPLECSGWVAP